MSPETVLVPVAEEVSVVAPEILYVKVRSVQLSLNNGSTSSSAAQVHEPVSAHFTTSLDGQSILGVSLSTTVIWKEHDEVFPHISVATKVTCDAPRGNAVPLAGPAV